MSQDYYIGPGSPTDLAWAAGFFDGEGSTTGSNKTWTIHISIGQAGDTIALERFKAAVGGIGVVQGPYRQGPPNPRHLPRYQYRANGFERAQMVMILLWPYLGPVKKAQYIERVRRFLDYRS